MPGLGVDDRLDPLAHAAEATEARWLVVAAIAGTPKSAATKSLALSE
jgi:hypothetical protein